jgi:hypothetical protein
LGLFYSNSSAAWFFIILALILGVLTYGIGALLVWGFSPIVGFLSVSHYNAKVGDENRKPNEFMKAGGASKQMGQTIDQDSVECPHSAELLKRKVTVCRC